MSIIFQKKPLLLFLLLISILLLTFTFQNCAKVKFSTGNHSVTCTEDLLAQGYYISSEGLCEGPFLTVNNEPLRYKFNALEGQAHNFNIEHSENLSLLSDIAQLEKINGPYNDCAIATSSYPFLGVPFKKGFNNYWNYSHNDAVKIAGCSWQTEVEAEDEDGETYKVFIQVDAKCEKGSEGDPSHPCLSSEHRPQKFICTDVDNDGVGDFYQCTDTTTPPTYSCTGTMASGSTKCTGDDSGLTANTPWLLVGNGTSSCTTTRKCESYCGSGKIVDSTGTACITCPTGATVSGNTCSCPNGGTYNSSTNTCTTTPPTYSCTGTMATDSTMCSGDNTGLTANTSWWLVGNGASSCTTDRKCESYCGSGKIANGSGTACITCPTGATVSGNTCSCPNGGTYNSSTNTCTTTPPTYSCTGTMASGSTKCTGDDSGLTANTPWLLVGNGTSSCTTTRKCESYCGSGKIKNSAGTACITCPSGATVSGNTCSCPNGGTYNSSTNTCTTPPSYSCTGSMASGSTMCTGDDSGLTANTPWLLVGNGTSSCTTTIKCESYCGSGKIKNSAGTACITCPAGATVSGNTCVCPSGSTYNSSTNTCTTTPPTYSCSSTQPSCSQGVNPTCSLTVGTPTQVNQAWVKDASNCGFVCTRGYTGSTCTTPPVTPSCKSPPANNMVFELNPAPASSTAPNTVSQWCKNSDQMVLRSITNSQYQWDCRTTTPSQSITCATPRCSGSNTYISNNQCLTCPAGQKPNSTKTGCESIPVVTCGSSNGGTFTSTPTSNLCSNGSAATISFNANNATFGWTCGSNSCSAKYKVSGSCGESANKSFHATQPPTIQLCNTKGPNGELLGIPLSPAPGSPDLLFHWTCPGFNGGSNKECTAYVYNNAECGTAAGQPQVAGTVLSGSALCHSGTSPNVTVLPNSWSFSWQCRNGHTNATIPTSYIKTCTATISPRTYQWVMTSAGSSSSGEASECQISGVPGYPNLDDVACNESRVGWTATCRSSGNDTDTWECQAF